MTRKDYERIAAAIRLQRDMHTAETQARAVIAQTARFLATSFEADNEHFDRTRFLAACGNND